MITADLPAALDRLVELGRVPDVNIRPVLLRVLVDLFVSRPNHGDDAVRQFAEIVSRLIEDSDSAGLLIVAEKLAGHAQVPAGVLKRLMAERGRVAGAILARAALDAATLQAAAALGTAEMAIAVARRADLDAATVRTLADRPESSVLTALADNPVIVIDPGLQHYLVRRARDHHALAATLLARSSDPLAAMALFLTADRAQRQAILTALRRDDLGRASNEPAPRSETARDQIARLALQPGQEGLDLVLGQALDLPSPLAERIVEDAGGEPLAVALAAVGATPELAARVFILGPPAIGHSYPAVKALVGIVEAVSPGAARRLVASMAGAGISPRPNTTRLEADERPLPVPRRDRTARRHAAELRRTG